MHRYGQAALAIIAIVSLISFVSFTGWDESWVNLGKSVLIGLGTALVLVGGFAVYKGKHKEILNQGGYPTGGYGW